MLELQKDTKDCYADKKIEVFFTWRIKKKAEVLCFKKSRLEGDITIAQNMWEKK